MPAAADDMATGFKTLNQELREEIKRIRDKYEAEITELEKRYIEDIEALRIRVGALEMNNSAIRKDLNREIARAAYFRNGAYRLYHQIEGARKVNPASISPPEFNPNIDKYSQDANDEPAD